jgi:hypothetical protein
MRRALYPHYILTISSLHSLYTIQVSDETDYNLTISSLYPHYILTISSLYTIQVSEETDELVFKVTVGFVLICELWFWTKRATLLKQGSLSMSRGANADPADWYMKGSPRSARRTPGAEAATNSVYQSGRSVDQSDQSMI